MLKNFLIWFSLRVITLTVTLIITPIITQNNMPKVFAQKWIEDETGWGERSDGYSLHLKIEDILKFIESIDQNEAEYLAGLRKIDSEAMLNEVSRPSGQPFEIEVENEVYEKIKQTPCGLMVNGRWSEIEKI